MVKRVILFIGVMVLFLSLVYAIPLVDVTPPVRDIIIQNQSVTQNINNVTNETARFGELVANDCSGSTVMVGVSANGTVFCSSAGSGDFSFADFQNSFSINFTEAFLLNQSNIFDQELNTTENVTFNNITLTGNLSANAIDVSGSVVANFFNGLFSWIINTLDSSTAYLTFNQSTLFFDEGQLNKTINSRISFVEFLNSTQLNDSYALIGAGGNASFNETRTNELYAGIEFDYNQTIMRNIFDQDLNTTNNVTFLLINVTNNLAIGLGADFSHELDVHGQVEIEDTAIQSDDHTLEIITNAAGFGDIKAIFIDYITGAISIGQDEEVILINIDQSLANGGDVIGLEVITTEGGAMVIGLEVGVQVSPIEQLSGVFGDMNIAMVNEVNQLAAFISAGSDVTIFENNDDSVTIGNLEKFEEIEFLLDTIASGAGIRPEFFFSTGATTWTEFNPTDGTDGMRNTGVIVWLDADIPTWATNGSDFLIRINRTQGGLATPPVEDLVQIAVATQYFWDKNGYVSINNLSVNNITLLSPSLLSCAGALQTDSTGNIICGAGGSGDFSFTDFQYSFGINFTEAFNTNLTTFEFVNSSALNDSYALIGSGGNLSFNKTYTDTLYSNFTVIEFKNNFQDSFNINLTNIFDQSLNTTSNVIFNGLNLTGDAFVEDGNGLVIGHNSFIDFGAIPEFQIIGTEVSDSSIGFAIFNDGASNAPDFRFLKSRGTTLGSNVLVVDGDRLGRIRFQGADGNDFNTAAAEFQVEVDGTASLNNVFGRFIWKTRSSGGLSEKMRLTKEGNLGIGTTTPTHLLNVDGTTNLTGGINLSAYQTCTALETDASGNLVCGTDADSGASSWVFATDLIHNGTAGVNVGIGTTSPAATLHIENKTSLAFPTSGSGGLPRTTSILQIINSDTSANAAGIWFRVDSASQAQGDINYVSDNDGNVEGRFAFRMRSVGNTWGEMVSFLSNGSVGIGTTTPRQESLLEVAGNITIDGGSSGGACLRLRDTDDAGYTYVTVLNGILTASQTEC